MEKNMDNGRCKPPAPTPTLPIELVALVDFLDADDRPTAILHIPTDGCDAESNLKAIHLNPAFNRLLQPTRELQDLQNAVGRSHTAGNHLRMLHDKVLQGGCWKARVSGDYCIVVAIDKRPDRTHSRRLVRHPTQSPTGSIKSHASHSSSNASAPPRPFFDWTRAMVPGLTSYVKFIRDFDWSSTALGPMHTWSEPLRQCVVFVMANPDPRLVVWGDDMTFIYNEACLPLFGAKHPEALGQNVQGVFAEAWHDIGFVIDAGYRGETKKITRFPLPIQRSGYLEESYWDFTTLPISDAQGYVVGVFDELVESTPMVVSERRRGMMEELGSSMERASTLPELWPAVINALAGFPKDVPFAILYAVVDDGPEGAESSKSGSTGSSFTATDKACVLVDVAGLPEDIADFPRTFSLPEHAGTAAETGLHNLQKAVIESWISGGMVMLSTEDGTFPPYLGVTGPLFGDTVKSAIVTPIKTLAGRGRLAFLVMGISPNCPFDSDYKTFTKLTVDIVEKAAAMIALPEEQRRAQKIADDVNTALAQQLRLTTLKAEKSEAKFSRMASAAPTGMFMFDAEGRELYVNDAYLEVLGITREEHEPMTSDGCGWKDQVHEDDLERFTEVWSQITEEKIPITVEYRLKRPWQSTDRSGQEMAGETWLLATAFPEIEAGGVVTSIQGWLTDISHRKFSEQLLAQRLEDALENKRQTENFIDMTSHEMRNPLSAILQSADSIETILNSTGMPIIDEAMSLPAHVAEDIIDAAQTIILCAQHQKRIVDDILTLSKLDASLLVIAPDKVQAPILVTKALKMYEAEIERAGIDAQLCIEPTYDELQVDWVILDPSRLLQVIINLLTNSIKFTQYSDVRKIQIFLGASRQKPTGKHHGISFIPPRQFRPARTPRPEWGGGEDIYLQFAVYDSGRGLSDEEMKLLFQRFQQASPKTYKQYGGSGLGLFISRELCELQGGQIGVSSHEGKTVFTFFVQAKRWVPDDLPPSRPSPMRYTSAAASPVAYGQNGSVMLPGGFDQMSPTTTRDGIHVEEFRPRPQYAFWHTSSNDHVPTTTSTTSTTTNGSSPTATAASPVQPKPPLHVLIVEDNLINQKVMSQQLRRAGCTVHVANHGLECLTFLERSTFCEADTPLSLVLLDLEMPTMDGLTCIRHIRERQTNGRIKRHVPVIAVTANARSEQITSAIEAGMDQVVTSEFWGFCLSCFPGLGEGYVSVLILCDRTFSDPGAGAADGSAGRGVSGRDGGGVLVMKNLWLTSTSSSHTPWPVPSDPRVCERDDLHGANFPRLVHTWRSGDHNPYAIHRPSLIWSMNWTAR
jgi:PAS domain S-box-containing protein